MSEKMHIYTVSDIWMALKLSSSNFFSWMFILWGILFGIKLLLSDGSLEPIFSTIASYYFYFSVVLTPVILIQSVFIYLANRRYIVDLNTGMVTFPRSDMENSILAIILLFPYWNLMRTLTIHASDIENLYLDTKRWSTKSKNSKGKTKSKRHVRYTINIAGTFGSANLQFLNRQKRDEVRNAIQQCVKQISGKNIDRKVAEFS